MLFYKNRSLSTNFRILLLVTLKNIRFMSGLALMMSCLVSSCKNDTQKNSHVLTQDKISTTSEERKSTEVFQIEMKVRVLKNDKFQLFFEEFENEGYATERVINVNVNGRNEEQTLVFNLPEGVLPYGIRLDFGENQNQDAIDLLNINLRFEDREYSLDNGRFLKIFKPNKFVEYNEADQTIRTKVIEGVYDPYFVSGNLDEVISNLLN